MCLSGVTTTLFAALLPWGSSGARSRNSFELVAVAARLDLLPASVAGASAAWSLLPVAVAAIWLAMPFRRRFVVATISLCVGFSALGLAVAVIRSPLHLEVGAPVALITATTSVAGALIVFVEQRRQT